MSFVTIERKVLEKNDEIARQNRELLTKHGIFSINLVSSPGAGRTTLLERTFAHLGGRLRARVVEGDVQTDFDAKRIAKLDVSVVQIVTNGACHLEAKLVQDALAQLDLRGAELLVIENVGNLVCPASFDSASTSGRPPQWRGGGLRRLRHRNPGPVAGDFGRGADPRLQGLGAGAATGDGRPPRHPQSQPRDGGAALPDGAAGRPVRPGPAPPGQRPADGAGRPHQVGDLILGLGEEWDEVLVAMRDLRRSDVNILTLGQYLRPSDEHLPVVRFYRPEEFAELRDEGLRLGFYHIEASPLTRSSYHAWDQADKARIARSS